MALRSVARQLWLRRGLKSLFLLLKFVACEIQNAVKCGVDDHQITTRGLFRSALRIFGVGALIAEDSQDVEVAFDPTRDAVHGVDHIYEKIVVLFPLSMKL